MADLVPEFISVLRDIRDIKYPDIVTKHSDVVTKHTAVVSYDTLFQSYVASSLANANATALDKIATNADVVLTHADAVSTAEDAITCTEKALIASQVLAMTAEASTLISGSSASASYNPTTGKMSFGIPTGPKGDKGDAFVVNAIGLFAGRTAYDLQPKDFTYYATDVGEIYFKLSATSGDWSVGSPFGKGDTGDDGNGIASITLTGTVGSVDTYRILFTDATFFDFDVTNGSVTSVAGKTGAVVLTKADVGLSNVDNTSDANKPVSTAQQTALDLKANQATTYTKTETDTQISSRMAGLKNHLINGDFGIWQRGTSQTANGYGSDDRWINHSVGTTKVHELANPLSTEIDSINGNFLSKTTVTSVAGASNYCIKSQRIEDVTKLSGKTVTLSFWAKADANKNIAIEFSQNFGTGGTPSATLLGISVTKIAITTVLTKYSVTVAMPSVSDKTLGTDGIDTTHTSVLFWFEAGSDLDARTDSLGQQSGTFYLGNIQIEDGSYVTPFEHRPDSIERALCYRYFEQPNGNVNLSNRYNVGTAAAGTGLMFSIPFKVQKRISPTMVLSDTLGATGVISLENSNGNVTLTGNTPLVISPRPTHVTVQPGVAGYAGVRLYWTADAEL